MSFFDVPLIQMLATHMSYDSERQVVLSQNLANIDTPGYRPKDLEKLQFKDILTGGAQRLAMTTTSPVHISQPGGATTQFSVIQATQGLEGKPNGNGVSLEGEMLKMAQNQGDFTLSTTVYQKMIQMFQTALGPNA